MRAYFDTNVLLDVLSRRVQHFEAAAAAWSLAERGEIVGVISALSIANIRYIVRRETSKALADDAVSGLFRCFEVVPLDAGILRDSLAADWPDFEDAIQNESARRAAATHLLTRDVAGFKRSDLAVLTPADFIVVHQTHSPKSK